MTNAKSTKRALLSSVIALFLCFSMLLGTTFAWFTDSVTSANNKIVSGNLDIQLFQETAAGLNEISDSSAPLFGSDILWEPGMTQVVYLRIKNNGSLGLKYKVAIDVTNVTGDLHEVMSYTITPDAEYNTVGSWAGNGVRVVPGTNATQANDVTLLPEGEHYFALSVHMDEEAGNEYMNKSITFDIRVLAGQLVHENDSFGNTYDAQAGYPYKGYAALPGVGESAVEIALLDTSNKKVGTVLIPAAAKEADGATGYFAEIKMGEYTPNVTIDAGMEIEKLDIAVNGLAADNTEPVKVTYKLLPGLDPATVKVYHYDTEIACTYNPNDGDLTFLSANFSPFTIVYDAQSEYEPPVVPDVERPTATVTYAAEHVGEGKIEWGNYGQWSPTEGLDANLEAAFVFTCPDYESASEDLKAVIDAYRYWYCDFYVSLDKDLAENQIFLGGNYGSFGWIGFHNGDVTLAANEELPLLGSVTQNPWTYDDVESFVGEFTCGVGDVADALEGATFTVKLRLTNPENEAEYYDVNVVTHTFGGNSVIDGTTVVTTADGLQDAFENGSGNIELGGDIDLNDLLGGN